MEENLACHSCLPRWCVRRDLLGYLLGVKVLGREVSAGRAGEDSLPISNSKVQGTGSEESHSDGLETEATISSMEEVELQLVVDQWVLVDH